MIETLLLYLRIIGVVLLMSCLSPGPDARPAGLAAELAAISGELRIVIQKSRNVLTVYKGMTPVKSYWAAFGKGYRQGDKRRKGDKRTPEGHFYICSMNHSDRFYKFMGISYPGIAHAEEGMRRGDISYAEYLAIWNAIAGQQQPPWDTRLGGAIGIHGRTQREAITRVPDPANWTEGCIALNNPDVDELFSIASLGTPVTIIP